MTPDARRRMTLGNRFRLLIRFLGLTGILAAVGSIFVLFLSNASSPDQFTDLWLTLRETVQNGLQGARGLSQQIAAYALITSATVIILWALVEAITILLLVTGRRTLAGTAATLQIALASFLLIAINVYSFSHYYRWDLTRDRLFTLPPTVAKELRSLHAQSPTTIIVLQKHKTFSTLAGQADSFDSAADAKVVEKVRDLVDLFRELGGRFRVVTLDVNDKRFDQQLNSSTLGQPRLKEAILSAPESSIFFASADRVQRLSFSEFLQLDKTASREANGGKGNLVLRDQGVEGFANRILAIEEKRPKIALAVIHQALTTEAEGPQAGLFTSAGLKRTLEDHGFEVVDIVLKRWGQGPPTPAVNLLAENKLERLESKVKLAEARLRSARAFQLPPEAIEKFEKDKRDAEEELEALLADERAIESRRQQDLKAKFASVLADVDVLILPRLTTFDAASEGQVPPRLYRLTRDQVEVIRDFMKSGRPVMACLGPLSTPIDGNPRESKAAILERLLNSVNEVTDDFERLLAERGVWLGKDTILFDTENEALSAREADQQFGGGKIAIPPLLFDSPDPKQCIAHPNPLSRTLTLTGRSIGQPLDLRLQALRPVYIDPAWRDRLPFSAEFVYTSADSWNEKRPFPGLDDLGNGTAELYLPEFDGDPPGLKLDPYSQERRGPFPVGVAISSQLPMSWFDDRFDPYRIAALASGSTCPGTPAIAAALIHAASQLKGPESRLIVLGHGGIFTGKTLEPAQQQLLLQSVNWLLNRSDRLPRPDAKIWQYPRVNLTERQFALWRWGAFLGLPLVAIYVGLIVLMVRKAR